MDVVVPGALTLSIILAAFLILHALLMWEVECYGCGYCTRHVTSGSAYDAGARHTWDCRRKGRLEVRRR